MEENVVLPRPGDLQVLRRYAERLEAVPDENALRTSIVQQGLRLQAVKTELTERDGGNLRYGRGREPTAIAGLAHPVADSRRLEGAAGDAVDVDAPDDMPVLTDNGKRHHGLAGVSVERLLQRGALRLHGEVMLVPDRIPRSEELPVRAEHRCQCLRVLHRHDPGDGHHTHPLDTGISAHPVGAWPAARARPGGHGAYAARARRTAQTTQNT